jgi:hypothetical protein
MRIQAKDLHHGVTPSASLRALRHGENRGRRLGINQLGRQTWRKKKTWRKLSLSSVIFVSGVKMPFRLSVPSLADAGSFDCVRLRLTPLKMTALKQEPKANTHKPRRTRSFTKEELGFLCVLCGYRFCLLQLPNAKRFTAFGWRLTPLNSRGEGSWNKRKQKQKA